MCTKRKNSTFVLLLFVLLLCACCATVFGVQTDAWAQESSGLAFVKTSETTCSVKLLDKTVTTVRIPRKAEIDGNVCTVTSVATNGFAKATKLEKVQLPPTIKAIGNSAFSGCTNLRGIMLSETESIAANAFNSCKSLEYIILPNTVTSIGSTIFRGAPQVKVYARVNVAQPGWAANWNLVASNTYAEIEYGSSFNPEIEYKKVNGVQTYSEEAPDYPSMGLEGEHYVVADFQLFENGDCDVYIPAGYKGEADTQAYPVMRIAASAFNLNNVKTLTVGYSEEPIYIGTEAFMEFAANRVVINRPVILCDEIAHENVDEQVDEEPKETSKNVFGMASVDTIVLPDNIETIGESMFNGCAVKDILFVEPSSDVVEEDITSEYAGTGIVVLPLAVKKIEDNAFDGVNSLSEVRLTNNITDVGIGVFAGWTNSETVKKQIIVPYDAKSDLPAGWNSLWDTGCDFTIIVYKATYSITYVLSGGVNADNPVSYKSIDDILLKDATRVGYVFAGWYDNGEYKGKPIERIRGMSGDKTFYANWRAIEYSVEYNGNSPIDVPAESATGTTTHTYDVERTLAMNGFSLDGWLFDGWNTEADGSGVRYENGATVKNLSATQGAIVSLYAQWTPIPYKLTFETKGGDTIAEKIVHKGLPIGDLPVAVRKDCEFIGWSTNEYCDCNVNATDKLNKAENMTVYAQWRYCITFYYNNGSGTEKVKGKHNDKITLPSPFFGGHKGVWQSGGVNYQFGSQYTFDNASFNMIADWTEKTFEESRNSAGEYEIWTKRQFLWLRNYAMNGMKFSLKTDLEYRFLANWQPIEEFNGTLYGNGHKITYSHVAIESDFGFITTNYGTIDGVRFSPSIGMSANADKMKSFIIGGAVAVNKGMLRNVEVLKNINEPTISSSYVETDIAFKECLYNVGGVAGHNYGTVENCKNYASIGGTAHIGGIASLNMEGAKIINCENHGKILYNKASALDACIGGIAGTVRKNGTVTGCKNYAVISWAMRISASRSTAPRIAQCVGQLSNSATYSGNSAFGSVIIDNNVLLYATNYELQYVKNADVGYRF